MSELASVPVQSEVYEETRSLSPFGSLRRTRRFYDVLASIVVGIVVIFALGPIVWTVLTSFKTENQIVNANFTFLPTSVTFDNYVTLWRRSGYPHLLMNSAIVTGMTVLMSLIIGTVAAYSISRYRFRGNLAVALTTDYNNLIAQCRIGNVRYINQRQVHTDAPDHRRQFAAYQNPQAIGKRAPQAVLITDCQRSDAAVALGDKGAAVAYGLPFRHTLQMHDARV